MPRTIICTHHKTGTMWMDKAFRLIGEAIGVPVARLEGNPPPDSLPPPPTIVLDIHSMWRKRPMAHLRDRSDRLLHLIRDPRDVVISAAHHHKVSAERWLHRPMSEFGGRTYQQVINALPEGEERLRFEMLHRSGQTIRRMQYWHYAPHARIECTYEDLMADVSCELFGSIAVRLGLDEAVSRQCFWEASLFGGLAKQGGGAGDHVRSGAPRQWASVYTRRLGREFVAEFGEVLVHLGYEPDNAWVDRLPDEVSAADQTVSA